MLTIVGECDQQLFGMKPAERLGRQCGLVGDRELIAHASAVLSDDTIAWLAAHSGTVVTSTEGRPLAVVVDAPDVDAARRAIVGEGGLDMAGADAIGTVYIRKLRRRMEPLALSLDEQSRSSIERKLFASVYKGVTDVVTKYAWPEPALWLTRGAAALRLSPNIVTVLGLVLTIVAGWQFYVGNLAIGMVAAWLMTLLDTVDGKLARVMVTSSELGNWLDHGNDMIHPPLWWLCMAHGMITGSPSSWIWPASWVILATYVISRFLETWFKRRFGFNPFLWQRFDSRFRLVVSRRNIILLIMTVGLVLGTAVEAFVLSAAWSVVSVFVQGSRSLQAAIRSRHEPIRAWLG